MGRKGVYIIQFHNGFKIGISNDCERRINDTCYTAPWCYPILATTYLPCQYPRIIERMLLNAFEEKRRGEFIFVKNWNEIRVIIENNRYVVPEGMIYDRTYHKYSWVDIIPTRLEDFEGRKAS